MRPPYNPPPEAVGDPGKDGQALQAWLEKCDDLYGSLDAHTVPSRASVTVELLRLGASGERDPDVVLGLLRPRLRGQLEFRRKFPGGPTLERQFEVRSFGGCRGVDDCIGVLITEHAPPGSRQLCRPPHTLAQQGPAAHTLTRDNRPG